MKNIQQQWREERWVRKGVYATMGDRLSEGNGPWLMLLGAIIVCVIPMSLYIYFAHPTRPWQVPLFLLILLPTVVLAGYITFTCISCVPKYRRSYIKRVIAEYDESKADEKARMVYEKAKATMDAWRS